MKPLHVAKSIYNLPNTRNTVDELEQKFLKLNHYVVELQTEVSNINARSEEKSNALDHRLQQFDDRLADAFHQLTILGEKIAELHNAAPTSTATKDDSGEKLVANEHALDQFYVQFERWFRGTEAEIKERQSVYVPLFTESTLDSKKLPAVDIGCGNGEFVELLHENNIRAIGLDLNKAMIDRVKQKGLEGHRGDATQYLRDQKANSLMAITGFHIVEHIPFLPLVKMFDEAYRALAPGGFVIFETPNPENVIVGSCNFYNDPSHLHPLPPAFLELVMKTRGFQKVEIKKLHPIKARIDHKDPLVQEIAERMYGPQDYAVIAYK